MCGLTGFTSTNKREFNFDKFKLVAIANHERGSDSVGLFYNNNLITNAERANSYCNVYNYFTGTIFPRKTSDINTLIFHNRRHSRGCFGINGAQPFEYTTPDGVKHIFAHNGTLDNELELCNLYGLQKADYHTDSHLLGHIIANFGFKVLTEYRGTCAFLYYRSDKPNTIFCWSGQSQLFYDKEPEIERPLWFYKPTKTSVYFASEKMGLASTFNNPELCFHITPNMLTETDGTYWTETFFDRSHIKKEVQNYGHDWYDNYQSGNTTYYRTRGAHQTNQKLPTTDYYTIDRPEKSPQHKAGNKVYYWKGMYWRNGHLLTGEYNLDDNGNVYTSIVEGSTKYYFKAGYMMKNESCYNLFKTKQFKMTRENHSFVNELSWNLGRINDNGLTLRTTKGLEYTGDFTFKPLFSEYIYELNLSQDTWKIKPINTSFQLPFDQPDVPEYSPETPAENNIFEEDVQEESLTSDEIDNDMNIFFSFLPELSNDIEQFQQEKNELSDEQRLVLIINEIIKSPRSITEFVNTYVNERV